MSLKDFTRQFPFKLNLKTLKSQPLKEYWILGQPRVKYFYTHVNRTHLCGLNNKGKALLILRKKNFKANCINNHFDHQESNCTN